MKHTNKPFKVDAATTFQDILEQSIWEVVSNVLVGDLRTSEDHLYKFKGLYYGLLNMETHKEEYLDYKIDIRQSSEDPFAYIDISLYYIPDDELYSASFTDWEKWLGMTFTYETLQDIVNQKHQYCEIVAYILEEISWDGFEYNGAKKQREILSRRIEESVVGLSDPSLSDDVKSALKEVVEELNKKEGDVT